MRPVGWDERGSHPRSSTPWLPEGWQHPLRAELSTGHHLQPIRADDIEKDMPAVMGLRDRLCPIYGEAWGWPPADMTAEQDRRQLQRGFEPMGASLRWLGVAQTVVFDTQGCVMPRSVRRFSLDCLGCRALRRPPFATEVL